MMNHECLYIFFSHFSYLYCVYVFLVIAYTNTILVYFNFGQQYVK